MKNNVRCVAVDFGASSGRVILGEFDGEKIYLTEVYRFENKPVRVLGNLYWDILKLFDQTKIGLSEVKKKYGDIKSIGIDTWGVDYGIIDKKGKLIFNPRHYRDKRTENAIEDVERLISKWEIYKKTGIQFMQLNTIYQLFREFEENHDVLNSADAILFIPDLFNYFLTGEKVCEYTIASTSQLLNCENRNWDYELMNTLGFKSNLFKSIINPGSLCGSLTKEIQEETGLGDCKVFAVAGHDTASAVVGAPIDNNDAYLSCGTWSLLGIEVDNPIVNQNAYNLNWTNEGGYEGKIRFLKNITGLWIIQQLKYVWSKKYEGITYDKICELAINSDYPYAIDPDAHDFLAPIDMEEAVVNYCKRNFDKIPQSIGDIAKASYEGITDKYKKTIEELETLKGGQLDKIVFVGGGVKDWHLRNLTSAKTNKKIVAGPAEATALGNIVVQLISLGYIKNMSEARGLIRQQYISNE